MKKHNMEPRKIFNNVKESELFDNDDFLLEADNENEDEQEKRVTPEQIRIDSLKLALKIIKMFDKVTAEDLLSVSSKVSSYLINHQAGDEFNPADFDLDDNNSDDSEETEDVESDDFNLDDVDDFTIEDDEPTEPQKEESEESETESEDTEDDEPEDEEETNEGDGLLPDEFVI